MRMASLNAIPQLKSFQVQGQLNDPELSGLTRLSDALSELLCGSTNAKMVRDAHLTEIALF